MMRNMIAAALIAATAMPAMPALAQDSPREAARNYRDDVRDARQDRRERLRDADSRGDVRHANREYREDMRDARHDYRKDTRDWRQWRNYDYNRLPHGERGYYADRYYRDGRYYRERRLGRNDRIYRGSNGRYYCRRSDGTTGLIIGGIAGGALGNLIADGGSRTIATLIGAGGGALLGRSVDRGQVVCR